MVAANPDLKPSRLNAPLILSRLELARRLFPELQHVESGSYASIAVDARTAARAQPAFSLKNIPHNFPEYRTSVLPIYENSAGEAALQ